MRLGYPPVIIFKRQRDAYLTAMQRADRGDYGALGELVARAMYDNLNRFKACPHFAAESQPATPAIAVRESAEPKRKRDVTSLRSRWPYSRLRSP